MVEVGAVAGQDPGIDVDGHAHALGNVLILRTCSFDTTKLMYIGSNTSRDSNHRPHDSHYDVLTTTLKKG